MKKLSKKLLFVLIVAILVLTGCAPNSEPEVLDAQQEAAPTENASIADTSMEDTTDARVGAIHFVDDMENTIELDQACEQIITLYSAHTENLYSLGVGDKIIGVNKTAIYPPDAATKLVYDYKSDPEKIIAADPDCLLIRPFINRKSPDFVAAIEKAGIPVISLYPDSFDLFDEYIMKLGMLTGTENVAEQLLEEFYSEIAAISEITASIEPKKKAFFESTETNYPILGLPVQ